MNLLRDPHRRFQFAVATFWFTVIGWPTTHALMLLLHPPGFSNWAAHVLLGISWFAIFVTSLDLMATTDVRREQEDDD